MNGSQHWRRYLAICLPLAIIATLLTVLVAAPGMPPYNHTDVAAGQVIDNTVFLGMSAFIAVLIVGYLLYAGLAFRERQPGLGHEGPRVRGDAKIQAWWLFSTTIIVLFLAAYGTIRMLQDGAGGGQGPKPIAFVPDASRALQVQVIAQQWKFTYRWPAYGGVETNSLELPANTPIEFHVTSLDVIHSFWAYQLGVKADANPGFDNVAYATTRAPFNFYIECAELCGLWHGYMHEEGSVVPQAQFTSWIKQKETQYASVTKTLPPYALTYFPQPQRRGG
ncbi:MAG: cytochrome c oxidase subunit II [Solirubrobacteraceae bacterium]